MKKLWWQRLITISIIGFGLHSFGKPLVCSQIFTERPSDNNNIISNNNLIKKILLPNSLLNFNDGLYWESRTSELKSLHLSNQDLNRIEVKIGLLDRLAPSSKKWRDEIPNLSIMRARELTSLLSRYSLQDFQDSYIRSQFITQLYLLKENPWMGLKKSFEISRQEKVQDWALRGLEEHILSHGLKGALENFGFSSPTKLAQAKFYLKKIIANGWLGLPGRLPTLSKNLDALTMEKLLWEGFKANENELNALMKKDHLIDNYNQAARTYQSVGQILFISLMFYFGPEMQDQFEREFNEAIENQENSAQKIKARNEAFEKTMRELDKLCNEVDKISSRQKN